MVSGGYCPDSMVSEVPLVSVTVPPGVWRLLARFNGVRGAHSVCGCHLVSGGYCPYSMVSEVPMVSVGAPWCLEATVEIVWCPRCP